MITDPFDAGPTGTFRTLCRNYPDATVFKATDGFRSSWGPIFYRGRANGSARLLCIGQDPAQTEAFTRRILSGQAGRRVQGFVEKLGYTKSYLMVNAFLYGIYNQTMALPHLNDPDILAYRNRWLDAAFAPGRIETVVAFGTPAFNAWQAYLQTPTGAAIGAQIASGQIAFHRALHPTADKPAGPITRKDLLDNWNVALQALHPVANPDVTTALVPYGSDFLPSELPEIASRDLPMGLPAWMRNTDFWASMPNPPGNERANILVEVP